MDDKKLKNQIRMRVDEKETLQAIAKILHRSIA